VGHTLFVLFVGASPLCVGCLFVVNVYVSLFQSVPSETFT